MHLSFDYNHVTYDNNYFYQKRGTEMGNSASVSTANITVHKLLYNLFTKKNKIEFNGRFVDGGFLIVNSSNIDNMETWCKEVFVHESLNFTY